MIKLLYFLPLFFFAACVSKPVDPIQELLSKQMTESDSLHYMDLLFEDMEKERMEYVSPIENSESVSCGGILSEQRDHFTIRTDEKGEPGVNDEIGCNIQDRVYEYFSANRESNDVTNNFPLYSRMDKKAINQEIRNTQNEYELVAETGDGADVKDMLDFISERKEVWVKKLNALEVMKSDELPEISSRSYIEIECFDEQRDKEKLLTEVFKGIHQLRDELSQFYFDESYCSLFRRLEITGKSINKDKLNALSLLVPLRVISTKEDCRSSLIGAPTPVLAPPPIQIND